MGEVHLNFNGSSIEVHTKNCWCTRGESMTYLIQKAFQLLQKEDKVKSMKPFNKMLFVGDWEEGDYSTCSTMYKNQTIPCPMFHEWKECKIEEYDTECLKISKRSKTSPIQNKLFWIGQLSNHIRENFIKDYSKHPKVKAIALTSNWGHAPGYDKDYASLPDHCDYKYLIDMEGNGYSARVKFLMHSRRPIFYQKRMWNEYWFWDIKEYKHYIPVANNLSDLDEKIDWAENNPDKCKDIADNAADFAAKHLRKKNAIKRLRDIIFNLGVGEYK